MQSRAKREAMGAVAVASDSTGLLVDFEALQASAREALVVVL